MKSFQRFDKEQKHTLDSLLQFCHDVIRSCSNHSQKHADTLSRSYIIPTHHAIHHANTPCTMHRMRIEADVQDIDGPAAVPFHIEPISNTNLPSTSDTLSLQHTMYPDISGYIDVHSPSLCIYVCVGLYLFIVYVYEYSSKQL